MPRNGSGTYTKPSGTTFAANTTILSAKVNEVIDDLVTDANTVRPVVAGGTEAATAAGARTNLELDKKLVFSSKSAGYTAVATDNNAALRFTGAYTLALTAAATLAANWHITVIADGGAVTVDPDASETINGAATLTIADGSAAIIFCTGATFYARTIQPYGALLTAIEALTTAAGKYLGFTGADTVEMRDIIGTVSGTGGGASTDTTYTVKTPTGALVESGAGANGHYAKWADGTMICWMMDGNDKTSDSATGNLYSSTNNGTWTFPAVFVIAPVVTGSADTVARWVSCATPTTTTVEYKHWSAVSAGGAVNTRLMAVGRWY